MEKIMTGLLIVVGAISIVALLGILLAFPVMWTWNATMPYLFSLPTITWGKAWCLVFLANMLLKSSNTNTSK